MPGSLDCQSEIKVGQDAVVSGGGRREQLQYLVAEDRCLDSRPSRVHYSPVERRGVGAETQTDGPVTGHADIGRHIGPCHRGASRVKRTPLADSSLVVVGCNTPDNDTSRDMTILSSIITTDGEKKCTIQTMQVTPYKVQMNYTEKSQLL